jgi:hypothetical protein
MPVPRDTSVEAVLEADCVEIRTREFFLPARGEYVVYITGSPDTVRGIYRKGYDFNVQGISRITRGPIRPCGVQ